MGIISGILWVIFGLLYVWYKSLREDPENTIAGTVLCVAVVSAIGGFFMFLNWILKANLTIGVLIGVAFCVGLVAVGVKWTIDGKKEKQKSVDKYNSIMDIVRQEEYTEDEIFQYALKWRMYSPEGWKYYSWGYEKCKPLIIEDYRKNVRYYEVAMRQQNEDHNASED